MNSPAIDDFQHDQIIIMDEIKIEDIDNEDDDDPLEHLLDNSVDLYLDEDDIIVEDHQQETDEEEEEEKLFHCSTCDTNFRSVDQHIAEFHADENVQLDGSNNAIISFDTNNDDDDDDALSAKEMLIEQFDNDDSANETVELIQCDYECSVCSDVFATRNALNGHMHVHKPHRSAKSRGNNKLIRKTNDESLHTIKSKPRQNDKSNNNELLNFVCDVCNTTLMSSKSLKLHLRMHLPVKTITLQQAALQQPESAEDANVKSFFRCDICDKNYDLVHKDIHMQTHNGDEVFRCGSCNITFANKLHLDMHMAAKQKPRVIHTKASQNNIRLPYACQYCTKEFARPHEKVKHERIHTGEKPYACEICGKTFRVTYCLTLHMRTHTDDRPYVCPHCNKRYKAPSVYNHHLLTHSDVRAFQCPFCPKAFKTHVQLSGHKNSHTKPFACTECNRPFATLFAVKSHMEIHKRPQANLKHSCGHCGASYTRAFALKNHIQKHHPEVPLDDALLLGTVGQLDDEESQTDLFIMNMDDEDGLDQLENDMGEEVTITSEIDHFAKEEIVTDWMK